MQMTDSEIVRDYKAAAKKGKQIGILADMNGCSRDKIREILLQNGISEAELPSKPGRRSEAEKEVLSQQTKEPAEEVVPEITEAGYPTEELKETAGEKVPKITEPVHLTEIRELTKIPFEVKCLCLNRIDAIKEVIANLAEEKMVLEAFLETCE